MRKNITSSVYSNFYYNLQNTENITTENIKKFLGTTLN